MSVAARSPSSFPPAAIDVLETSARSLAKAQVHLAKSGRDAAPLEPIGASARIARIHTELLALATATDRLPPAAEWFLDNYYLTRRAARQVEKELPPGFISRLPRLSGGTKAGKHRIVVVAQVIAAKTGLSFDLAALRRFVDAYQLVAPLTIAELWAFPTILRGVVLTRLLETLEVDPAERESRDAGRAVEKAIRSLRLLDVLDWKSFFVNTSRVEAVLQTDPAGVYARMDFATRDVYRKVIENCAWEVGESEVEVARIAIDLAHDHPDDGRRGHVGYYLVGAGRPLLESRIKLRLAGLDRVRRFVTESPTTAYLVPLALLTTLPLLALASYLGTGNLPVVAFALFVAIVPTSTVAVAMLRSFFAWLLPPRVLPKLDFSKGLTSDVLTLVVIPTLLGRRDDVATMLRQIELHFLSNPDPLLRFALLTDDVDEKRREDVDRERPFLDDVSQGIRRLNAKHGKEGIGPFHLLHREPAWNPSEERFMGWERKRGKLEQLNEALRGDIKDFFAHHIGEASQLRGIRFVITLDSDTELPMGSAHRLVGLLAHPLNEAVFEQKTGRVTSGYTIVQPRIGTSPSSSRPTLFSRLFAGDVGFDIYTHASSELYQDLFGAGIYVGKGIYDVDGFMRSVKGRVPENTLVSHDLFEGVQGRAALASDIVLFENFPSTYATFALRMHRWSRGDWQLVPWLFRNVPGADGRRLWNKLVFIDRYKIADNLRRSLAAPSLVLFLVVAWLWLPGNPAWWTLGAVGVMLAPALPALRGNRRVRIESAGRALLALAFLPYEAGVVLDAIARVAVRTTLTHKHLLEWTSAAHAAFGASAKKSPFAFWRTMIGSPLFALGTAGVLMWLRPSSLAAASPLLGLWMVAPEVARRLSRPFERKTETITAADRRELRRLARRTWRFFDAFVGPNDQWLPIDNYQEEPREQTAHRTSPTNIGLMLTATLAAYDFGYLGPKELSLRVRRAFDSIGRLTHYQGHLFNWYDTKSLQPLLPRYVSTVDSGNFAGCLLALRQGLDDVASSPVVRREAWEGLADSLALLRDVVDGMPLTGLEKVRALLTEMDERAAHAGDHLAEAPAILRQLGERGAALDHELLAFLESGAHRHEADLLRALRTAIVRLDQQLREMQNELDSMLPWLALPEEAARFGLTLPADLRLDELASAARSLRAELAAKRDGTGPAAGADRLDDAFRRGEENAETLVLELRALARHADEEARGMDFKLVYDADRRLFVIGYNATSDQRDTNHYDLMASEARLASYLAIVKGDVPESHWYALGRPMTTAAGLPALMSWGGSMFEYLMPNLLMRSQPETLLAQTCAAVVDGHIAQGHRDKEPWGVSESAYARLDAEQTYQYRSFGVPGFGFRRELEDDRVVTPYASILAASVRPKAVVTNVRALEKIGMLGTYGLFEAIDFTPERALEHGTDGQHYAIVRSYMAHHQGMILVALGNLLNRRTMVQRFHANAMVETGEALLNERAPEHQIAEIPQTEVAKAARAAEAPTTVLTPTWSPSPDAQETAVLSNGKLTSLLTSSGGGGLRWKGLALTRYDADPARDDDGYWFYVRDEDTKKIWRATSFEGRTTIAMHQVTFHRRYEGISIRVDVAVGAGDDVEIRQLTIHNETNRPRTLTLTSAARPVLFDPTRAAVHPAFASMFIESEAAPDIDGLVFTRRQQTTEEDPIVMVHRLVREGTSTRFAGTETDRTDFYGRGGNVDEPAALAAGGDLRGRIGTVIDPIMSVMARVELKPKGSATLAFVTSVGRSRSAAVDLSTKYGSMHAVRWTFRDVEHESPRRLLQTKLDADLLPTVQRLLSALVSANRHLRAPLEVRRATPPSQERLWGRGISGDDPIVAIRVHDPETGIIEETLAVQRYLRACGIRFEIVMLDEQASGYLTETTGTLRSVLVRHDVDDWLNRRGGIFIVAVDQVAKNEIDHLEACARVLLDTRDGSLRHRLALSTAAAPLLPQFQRTIDQGPLGPPAPRAELLFDNGLGGFSPDGREYVIDVLPGKPTPAPWCNVIANATFGCLASESSLGASWSENSGENRLTPWRNDPVFDPPSEALYLRDEETAAIWSSTPRPAGSHERTRVRHGAGYTTYEREDNGLVQEMTVFVPPGASLKIVRLRLCNTLPRHRRLTATYFAEWVLGSRREVQRPFLASEVVRDHGCLLATCSWSAEFAGRVAFVGALGEIHGFTTDRAEFLGRHGDYARPEGLTRWGLSNTEDPAFDTCAALQVHLDIGPEAALETHFVLGQSATRDEALALVAEYRNSDAAERAWKRLGAFWDDILGNVRVKTPEPAMDLLLNRWLLYQTLSSRVFGRTGFYQSSGAFGYRDQLQDVMALLHAAPALARAHILEAARHQFEEGDVLHWWHPPSGRGVRTHCSDDLAWLPFVTAEYVKATGDLSILDTQLSFLEAPPLKADESDRYAHYDVSKKDAPLLEHCRRALERAMTAGIHGLPLMGSGDWNDGMSRIGSAGKGESVWLAWFLCAAMDRFADLSSRLDHPEEAARWTARAVALRGTVDDVAWDGGWYLRAFHDDGSRVGSAESRECRIDSIAQSWAVLGAPAGRSTAHALTAVRAADAELVNEQERLVRLFWPPFDSTIHDPGYIRAYPPGVRENGGQYTHAATWLGHAYAALGDGHGAERVFRLLNPVLRAQTPEAAALYRVEPYALAGDVYGSAPWVGRGGWTWYTGAAAWMWRLGTEAILGLHRDNGALRLDPCIPPAWDGFEAWVRVGERTVHVVVENPDHVSTGVASRTLDGANFDGLLAESMLAGPATHEVRLTLG